MYHSGKTELRSYCGLFTKLSKVPDNYCHSILNEHSVCCGGDNWKIWSGGVLINVHRQFMLDHKR